MPTRFSSNGVPMEDREWLKQLRQLKGISVNSIQEIAGVSLPTYYKVEKGSNYLPIKSSTLSAIAGAFGIKLELFYFKTDDEGRLIDINSVSEILAMFAANGYRGVVRSPEFLSLIFNEEVSEFIFQNNIA